MERFLIPPREPIRAPMIYIERQTQWEYKRIVCYIESETPLDESELNELGKNGWEMTGIIQQHLNVHYYFKRELER